MDGREPGMGDYPFDTLLATLAELNYSGWVSVEAFDFSRDSYDVAPGDKPLKGGYAAAHWTPGSRCSNIMNRYIVTGGAGFIGSALVQGLACRGPFRPCDRQSFDRQSA